MDPINIIYHAELFNIKCYDIINCFFSQKILRLFTESFSVIAARQRI